MSICRFIQTLLLAIATACGSLPSYACYCVADSGELCKCCDGSCFTAGQCCGQSDTPTTPLVPTCECSDCDCLLEIDEPTWKQGETQQVVPSQLPCCILATVPETECNLLAAATPIGRCPATHRMRQAILCVWRN